MAAASRAHIALLTLLAMLAFAGNSLLCRLALKNTSIDAASFTSIRLIAAAITLWLLVRVGRKSGLAGGNWLSALALFTYAAGPMYHDWAEALGAWIKAVSARAAAARNRGKSVREFRVFSSGGSSANGRWNGQDS